MRALGMLMLLTLCACAAQARPLAPPRPAHGAAYVDVPALVKTHPLYGTVRVYDRQIAALRATRADSDLAGAAERSRRAAALVLHEATAGAATQAYAIRASATDRAREQHTENVESLVASIRRGYVGQTAVVRGRAADAGARFAAGLDAHRRAAAAALAGALNARVQRSYAARAQRLAEAASDAAAARERAVAPQQLQLRIALTIATNASTKAALRAHLDHIASRLARQAAAQRSRDAAELSAYRGVLQQAAAREQQQTVAMLGREAQANLQVRKRVTQAQTGAPVALPAIAGDRYRSAMNQAAQSLAGPPVTPDLTVMGANVAQRLATIGDDHAAATAGATREMHVLEAARTALYARIAASVQAEARAIAQARGLRYVDRPTSGAVDLTSAVRQRIAAMLGG